MVVEPAVVPDAWVVVDTTVDPEVVVVGAPGAVVVVGAGTCVVP